ncbi:MAG: hypothetical protein Q4D98_11630 [Planctomycetia bacterium]|nr:hypothetical protein [Planctomycetia bacterium]
MKKYLGALVMGLLLVVFTGCDRGAAKQESTETGYSKTEEGKPVVFDEDPEQKQEGIVVEKFDPKQEQEPEQKQSQKQQFQK